MNDTQQAIYGQLVESIVGGVFTEHDRLPTELELCERFKTSRMNAHAALKLLERRGVVTRNKKGGTVVARTITSSLARELKGEVSKRVCVIDPLPDPDARRIFWNERMLSGLESVLRGERIEAVHQELIDSDLRRDLEAWLKKLAIDGVAAMLLVLGNGANDLFILRNLDLFHQHFKHNFVFLRDSSLRTRIPFHTVGIDTFGEGRLAGAHLYVKGCRDIVFHCADQPSDDWRAERLKGMEFGLRRISDGSCQPRLELDRDALRRQISAAPGAVGVVAENDELAVTLVDHFALQGLERGRDYLLVSFDDDRRFRSYNLTTIAPALEEIGAELGKLIVEHIDVDRDDDRVVSLRINSKLIEREGIRLCG